MKGIVKMFNPEWLKIGDVFYSVEERNTVSHRKKIHQEINGDHRTIGFIVRSQRSGTFRQFRYTPDTGDVTEYGGPTQIPFELA